jgi:hypothetical protein
MGSNFVYFLVTMAFLAFVTSACLLLAGYLPRQLFNNGAKTDTCTTVGSVYTRWCRSNGITRQCYDVQTVVENTLYFCYHVTTVGTFYSYAEAEQYLARFHLPISYTCYVSSYDPCSPSMTLKDATNFLWAGIIFASMSMGFVLWVVLYCCCHIRNIYQSLV